MWGAGPPPEARLILFTMVSVYPALKVLNVPWCAGSFDDEMIQLVYATFTNFARLNGCSEVEIRGRPGWELKLREVGFRREAMIWTTTVAYDRMN